MEYRKPEVGAKSEAKEPFVAGCPEREAQNLSFSVARTRVAA